MRGNFWVKLRNLISSSSLRAVAGRGLVLILTFAGSASADDVVFGFAADIGGTSDDKGHGIAVDASGNVYTTGSFSGTVDFDPGTGTVNLTSAGSLDIFVQKLNFAGDFVWARRIGGTGTDEGLGIAVDASGNVHTTGYFEDTVDFDPGTGTTNLTSADREDIFVSKLNCAGNFVWARRIGGTRWDRGFGIAVDSSGNVHTTGYFWETVDFDPGAGTVNLTSAGLEDTFVSKLNCAGNFVWARRIGGTRQADGHGIAVDLSGNVYTTGTFQDTVDFDPGTSTFDLTSAGSGDSFVQKLTSAGNFVWAKAMHGANWVQGRGIGLDSSGNAYTTGSFRDTTDFDPGASAFNLTSATGGIPDIFVSKLSSAGNFVWAKAMGGTGHNEGFGIAVDSSGNVYTTGDFQSTADFDPGVGTFNLTSASAGLDDIFISRLDSAGNFVWAKAMGGTENDRSSGIAVDASGNVYTTGFFNGTADFDPGAGTVNLTSAGFEDIFVLKLGLSEPALTTWVDFGFGGSENGSVGNPFDTFTEGLAHTAPSGTVKIKGNTGDSVSNETMTIDQGVTIEAISGTVRIGDAGGRSADTSRQSGFVSRD